MGAPEAMHRREEEDERHHRAFLLYAMQGEEDRSLRAVARALGASDNSVRKWRTKHGWHDRMRDPEVCRHACDLYAQTYHAKLGGRDVAIIRERLGAEYIEPGAEHKSEVARSIDLYDRVEREEALAAFDKAAQTRSQKLRTVLDATLGRVAKGLAEGDIVPTTSAIGQVIRGYKLLEESEARRLAMLPSADDEEGAGPRGENVATSQRVLQAQASGGDVLDALLEDAEELTLLLRTLRTHERESNLVRLDSRREASGSR